jgi:oligopeptidase B
VEDFEACVRAVQEVLELPASKTCIYGRSAGGYVLGSLVARHPQGDLFRAAYAEVPYVDVLRTASNPKLPLTRLEFEEFGDPAGRIEDFESILRLSPVDSLSSKGAPGVFVVCRTAKNDKQVYAYESFKWVQALRGDGKRGLEKLVAMNPGQGHFTLGVQLQLERAEDYLLICKNLGID